MSQFLIKNATIVNENQQFLGSVLIENDRIKRIFRDEQLPENIEVIDATGKFLIPGVIDDQVHFREPGLTHKADIKTDSKAAIAGGVTSFMEMPNTNPQTTTIEELNKKFEIAKSNSSANYSFYFGATNTNIEEVKKIDPSSVCGIKVFMGSSTGNMLVDNDQALEDIFKQSKILIATHCEDETTIKTNLSEAKKKFGSNIPFSEHPNIRSREACYKSSSKAVELAQKHNTRLHILHISTKDEIELFSDASIQNKNITAEVCVHHLWFDDSFYETKKSFVKWNPAIKTISDRDALRQALIDGKLDVVATDHAPHTIEEKNHSYLGAPSGGPLVQHSLVTMLELYHKNVFSLEMVVEKMCHNPAKLFNIVDRGFIREGYYADLVLLDLNKSWKVDKSNIHYKCGWSPFEGQEFNSQVCQTFVNGKLVFDNGLFTNVIASKPLRFNR